MVCVTTGSALERKGLSGAVTWVHLFRQPFCWMVPSKLLSTCLSIILQAEGAEEQPGPELSSEAICATSRTLWNMCHSCLASLLSALIAWGFCCPLALRYALVLFSVPNNFCISCTDFHKEQTSKSLKSKHLVVMSWGALSLPLLKYLRSSLMSYL